MGINKKWLRQTQQNGQAGNRFVLRVVAPALLAFIMASCQEDSQPQPSKTDTPVTTTVGLDSGAIQGNQRAGALKEFLGIPYAAPPLGKLRWRAPQPVEPWAGTLDTRAFGLPCLQPPALAEFYDRKYPQTSEDCLTLNVWTRATNQADRLPVMVWIHGGALVIGSGSDYDGAALTERGVVLVTINYRLGPFGFFAHPELSAQDANGTSGNQGYRDQIAALQWVQANIQAFGGDPNNVTIFGESAGSWSMSVLQASPLARGLFHKVIGQSGARFLPLSDLKVAKYGFASAEQRGVQLSELFTGQPDAPLASLREMPAQQMMDAYAADPDVLNNFDALTIVDGHVLPAEVDTVFAASQQANVPVLVGSNAQEASTFDPAMFYPEDAEPMNYGTMQLQQVDQLLPEADAALQDYYPVDDEEQARTSWIDFRTDAMFTQPMNLWAEHMLKVSSPAYLYWWDWQPSIEGSQQYGAFHAADVAYVFGDLDMFDIDNTPDEQAFANLMMDIWTQFAKTGDPSIPGVITWPAYTETGKETAILGPQLSITNGVRLEQVGLITEAFNRQRAP